MIILRYLEEKDSFKPSLEYIFNINFEIVTWNGLQEKDGPDY